MTNISWKLKARRVRTDTVYSYTNETYKILKYENLNQMFKIRPSK